MTYAAEPYAQFVDDLLTALTGGAIRDEFRFLPEEAPFQLSVSAPVLPKTVRVFGLAGGTYKRFRLGDDFDVKRQGSRAEIAWKESGPGKTAVSPELGSTFFVNYEYQGSSPSLTDRNTGSVTRLLAESFAREYATVSKQLEGVYQAGFLDTAKGRDLEQLASLVGIKRRQRLSATGSVVFSRTTPATGDIVIQAGTKLSTAVAPAAVFETTEDRTLQRGALSVEVPVTAVQPGEGGLVDADAITIMNRPILGIDTVGNALPTRFGGSDETDDLLRARARRALEAAGKATTGGLLGALTALPGLREKDIRIVEDYLAHPGVVKLYIAAPVNSDDFNAQALDLIDATRPVGIRILPNFTAPRPPGASTASTGTVAEESGSATIGAGSPLKVDIHVQVTPTSLSLSTEQRAKLTKQAEDVVTAFLADAGVGEVLVYNRLVAQLMALEGALDVDVSMLPHGSTESGRKNLVPENPAAKPMKGEVIVRVGGALVTLDVAIGVTVTNAALGPADQESTKAVALEETVTKLDAFVATLSGTLSREALLGAIDNTDTYNVTDLHYQVDYMDAGVRIHQQDVRLALTGLERVWIRKVGLITGAAG